MPVIGVLTGGGTLGEEFLWLSNAPKPETVAAAKETGEAYIAWGPFAQTTLDFLIVAFAIFLMIKGINHARAMVEKKEEEAAAEPTTKTCDFCQSDIPIKAIRCPHCTSQLASN